MCLDAGQPIHVGAIDYYWTVFSPLKMCGTDDPVVGSLESDVAEIYADLSGPLRLWRTCPDDRATAIWEWRFGFRSHWGRHALGAISALADVRERGTLGDKSLNTQGNVR